MVMMVMMVMMLVGRERVEGGEACCWQRGGGTLHIVHQPKSSSPSSSSLSSSLFINQNHHHCHHRQHHQYNHHEAKAGLRPTRPTRRDFWGRIQFDRVHFGVFSTSSFAPPMFASARVPALRSAMKKALPLSSVTTLSASVVFIGRNEGGHPAHLSSLLRLNISSSLLA